MFDEEIGFYAVSLSFYSVLAIIPLLWVLFFMFDHLGVIDNYYQLIKTFMLDSLIPSHAEIIVSYIETFLSNAKRMGLVEFIYIVVASVLFYKNYQYVLSIIFMVPNHGFLHSVATYLVLAS